MDLRKVTCSECKSHLHYMENMSVSGCCYCEANVRHVGRDQHENGLQDA